MEEITIRPANLNDLKTLLGFEQGVILAERPFDVTIKPGNVHYYNILEMIEASHIELLVAESKHRLIGSGYARIEKGRHYLKHEQHAYLGFMYVHSDFHGMGVNKLIIDALMDWSKSHGINELRLDVYVDNKAAINAYEKAGFSGHMLQMRMGLDD